MKRYQRREIMRANWYWNLRCVGRLLMRQWTAVVGYMVNCGKTVNNAIRKILPCCRTPCPWRWQWKIKCLPPLLCFIASFFQCRMTIDHKLFFCYYYLLPNPLECRFMRVSHWSSEMTLACLTATMLTLLLALQIFIHVFSFTLLIFNNVTKISSLMILVLKVRAGSCPH